MKLTLICLAIAICARLAFEAAAQTVEINPKEIAVSHPDFGTWAKIVRSDTKDYKKSTGFNPSYTSLITNFKPIVHKRSDGQYEVTFTSEIAENIP